MRSTDFWQDKLYNSTPNTLMGPEFWEQIDTLKASLDRSEVAVPWETKELEDMKNAYEEILKIKKELNSSLIESRELIAKRILLPWDKKRAEKISTGFSKLEYSACCHRMTLIQGEVNIEKEVERYHEHQRIETIRKERLQENHEKEIEAERLHIQKLREDELAHIEDALQQEIALRDREIDSMKMLLELEQSKMVNCEKDEDKFTKLESKLLDD